MMDPLILSQDLRIMCDDKFNLDIELDNGYHNLTLEVDVDINIILSPDDVDQLYEYLKEYFSQRQSHGK